MGQGVIKQASQWIKAVQTLLQTTGIIQTTESSESSRSNIDIRQLNSFRDTLISLVAADTIHHTISWEKFLSMLYSGCSETELPLMAKHPNITVIPLTQIAGTNI